RFIIQKPVRAEGDRLRVRDEALHMVYGFGQPVAHACPFRVEPDMAAFEPAVEALRVLKRDLAALGVDTDGAPLGVHPAFDRSESAKALVARLTDFVGTHLTEARLSALSIAGIPAGEAEPWIFFAMQRDRATGGWTPVPSPAIAQPDMTNAPRFAQMLSFAEQRRAGAVVPPGRNRNRLPVDCLANFLLPGDAQPVAEDGVSTSTIFAAGPNTPEAAAEIGAVIADAGAAHFFNTDCVSCHTETRREIDAAAADGPAKAEAIALAEHIDPDAMPRGPADSNRRFDRWNVRAFGWYPGFAPEGRRAHATVVRRTARETDEVLACLNSGQWREGTGPCPADGAAAHPVEQGWDAELRERFYHTSQGGRIMPLAYFLALRTADGSARFAAPENLARYGLLPSEPGAVGLNRHALPVGFAVTDDSPTADIGLNCAACHAADVIAGGKRLRIEGAPGTFDFDRFLIELSEALTGSVQIDVTQSPPAPNARFQAFIRDVAAIAPALADPAAMRSFAFGFSAAAAVRRPEHPSGPGRVDALTQIVNALAVTDLGLVKNLAIPSAPTSYPALWLAPQLEFVQWNLTAADPLARNLGQALGVFGATELSDTATRFTTTARLVELQDYERWLEQLEAPAWPEAELGPIDTALAERGRDLFAANCERCHNAPPYRKTDPADNFGEAEFIKVRAIGLEKAGVDPDYINALAQRVVDTGPLRDVFGGEETVPAALYFGTVVSSATTKAMLDAGIPPEQFPAFIRMRPPGHPDCEDDAPGRPCGYEPAGDGLALKAGPLEAVWATGPYLHNGSVRTVYELLSPAEERAETFWIGNREIDAERLGFSGEEVPGGFLFDTALPGNGKEGHEFATLTHDERMAVIEYLKDPRLFPITR
ncbi:MAG: di-heme-cytochrome C peroxidase, partial [Pseudomonadota bacterium]